MCILMTHLLVRLVSYYMSFLGKKKLHPRKYHSSAKLTFTATHAKINGKILTGII